MDAVPLWRGSNPKLSRNAATLPRANNNDPLNVKGTREIKKRSLSQGTLPVAKTDTKTVATIGPPLAPQKEATKMTPTVHYPKPSWRPPFLKGWRSLP